MPINLYPRAIGSTEIRILGLLPAHQDTALECTLETSSLLEDTISGESPTPGLAYEAISYAWGSKSGIINITCNGQSLTVTRNLEAALRALRSSSLERRLWVDQICIYQGDFR